jgi:hypothetical protein
MSVWVCIFAAREIRRHFDDIRCASDDKPPSIQFHLSFLSYVANGIVSRKSTTRRICRWLERSMLQPSEITRNGTSIPQDANGVSLSLFDSKGEIMNRILMIAIAVPALALFSLSETAEAQHRCGYGGRGYYGGGYGYSAPRYSYRPAYSYRPVYRSAYVQPSYGISIGFGRSNFVGGYRGGFGGYRGGNYGGHNHHHHHH